MRRQVVVTGAGVIAPNGIGVEEFWQALLTGRSGIKEIAGFETRGFPVRIGGEVGGFNALRWMGEKEARRHGRFAQFVIAGVRMALSDAGLDDRTSELYKKAIIIGTSAPAADLVNSQFEAFKAQGVSRIRPWALASISSNAGTTAGIMTLGSTEFALTVSSGCASGLDAVGLGAREIRENRADVIIAGGGDCPLSPFTFGLFCASGMLAQSNGDPAKASRPFDRRREGGVLAEGAAVFVLEELAHARARGARRIYGEIAGYGESSDPTSHGGGLAVSMRRALMQGGVRPAEVDYICAHGPGDPEIDRIETECIKEVFGEAAYRIPVSSIKALIGNPLGAAGPLQLVACFQAMRDSVIPPTANYGHPDPACDLDYVPGQPRQARVEVALANAHGFGGSDATVVVKRCRS